MLNYNRIDLSEGIDVSNTRESKECGIRHYWHFLDKRLKFQRNICNGCHDVVMNCSSKYSRL